MKAKIYISGIIGTDTTLVDVIRQYKTFDEPDEVEVEIKSEGGDVEEGENIYDYLKGLAIPITTITSKAYSIAAQIFSVGDTRIVEDIDNAFMIHFAWAGNVSGKAEKFEDMAEKLREIEDRFVAFYTELIDIPEETVKALLDDETMLSGSEAKDMGFATELKEASIKAVAIYNPEINPKQNKSNMKKGKIEKITAAFNAFIDSLSADDKPEIKALVLQDSDGADIDFPDLEAGGTPIVGSKATIDGKEIPDESYIIPSMDDATLVFVDGAVTEIIPKEEEETAEAKAARIAAGGETEAEKAERIAAEEMKEIWTYSVTVVSTSFEEGETLMLEGWDDADDYAASAGEFRREDGSSIVTDAAGKIVKVKPASDDLIAEAEAKAKEKEEAETKVLDDKVAAKVKEETKAMKAEIVALKKGIVSKPIIKVSGRLDKTNTGIKGKKTPGDRASEIINAFPKKKQIK